MTIQKFETGNSHDISLNTLLRLLRVIGQLDNIETILPELPESPYLKPEKDTLIKRVRRKE